jgi:hypothetical protein
MAMFVVEGEILQGLAIWFGEAALLGLGFACCPTAAIFEKPWWDRSDD